jgi:hypothetical protein
LNGSNTWTACPSAGSVQKGETRGQTKPIRTRPQQNEKKYDAIVALTGLVCAERLDPRFAQLARLAAAALARKRPSPLEKGRANTWACAIVYALCYVNFVFDQDRPYPLTAEELCAAFGVAERTGEHRSKRVR